MKRRWYILMLLLVGGIFVGASQSLVEAAELTYSVKAVLPDNQISKDKTFFDLRMKPGEKQTIEVEVGNKGKEPVEVYMYAAPATTNVNGVIDYPDPREEGFEYDSTLKNPLSKILTMPEKVDVPAEGQVKVPIEITMPAEEYKGMIVGGLLFYQKDEEDEKTEDSSQSGMGVRNKFMYRIGIKLTENEEAVEPDLKLLGVKAGQVNYRNAVQANLQNPEPTPLDDLQVTAKVFPKGSSTAVYEGTKSGMRMAPNSNFEYPIYLGKKAFKPGKYVLKMAATGAKDKKWEFSQEFEITKEEADKLNKDSALELEYETNWWLYIAMGVGGLIVLLILIFVIVKVRKKKKGKNGKGGSSKKASSNKKKNGSSGGSGSSKKRGNNPTSKDRKKSKR